MTEVKGTLKVSRLASTRMRILLAVVALLVFVSVEIIVVLGNISGIDAAHPQDGVGAAKAWFLAAPSASCSASWRWRCGRRSRSRSA